MHVWIIAMGNLPMLSGPHVIQRQRFPGSYLSASGFSFHRSGLERGSTGSAQR
jgi:hypothetical protein